MGPGITLKISGHTQINPFINRLTGHQEPVIIPVWVGEVRDIVETMCAYPDPDSVGGIAKEELIILIGCAAGLLDAGGVAGDDGIGNVNRAAVDKDG